MPDIASPDRANELLAALSANDPSEGFREMLEKALRHTSLDELSPYMVASRARDLADEIEPDLRYACVHFQERRRPGADYWQSFCELVSAALESLG